MPFASVLSPQRKRPAGVMRSRGVIEAIERWLDVSVILPSVRARGILVPLLVRPKPASEASDTDPGTFEMVAGRRRYHAALIVAQENGDEEPVPCAIMDAGDDVAAVEASLIENIERLDPDEVSQWTTLTRLIQKEGRTVEQIAQTFGVTDVYVRRVLALGNLLPAIRELYHAEEIDATTIRHLTLASKARQKDWLALHDDPKSHAPTGGQLRAWLFGGSSIPTKSWTGDPVRLVATMFLSLCPLPPNQLWRFRRSGGCWRPT